MKPLISYLVIAISILTLSCEKEKNIAYDELPVASKNLIEKYFPDLTTAHVTKEKNDPYEVVLTDGTKMEFDKNGNWEEIKNKAGLPAGIVELLPTGIVTYLDANYNGYPLIKTEREYKTYEVELMDGTELVFDLNGNFLRIDEQGTGIPGKPTNTLPEEAQAFITTHFSGVKIVKIDIEHNDLFPYEVYLQNGTEIEFDKNGLWVEVDGNHNPLPESVVNLLPVDLISYISTNYQGQSIIKIDKEKNRIEVKLRNKIELQFDLNGKFLRIDRD